MFKDLFDIQKLRKERNTAIDELNNLKSEYLDYLKSELSFARKYEELLETCKELKSEIRQLKRANADLESELRKSEKENN